MRIARDDFLSVHPIGERVLSWPPKGYRQRKMTYFVPLVLDEGARMTADEAFVADNFPLPGEMTAVMPVPGGAIGYHFGRYGECWPTDPALRAECEKGGFFEPPVMHEPDKGVSLGP